MKPSIAHMIAKLFGIIFFCLITSVTAFPQQLISAKAGSIQFLQGEGFLNGSLLRLQEGHYLQMENNQVLTTGKGYAEILLAPNAYLRLGANASLRMRQNKLTDIHLELSHGSALIEILKKIKTDPIRIHILDSVIEIKKDGLYRLDAESRRLRVYSGDATAIIGNKNARIKKSRMVVLDAEMKPEKFDVEDPDTLHRWAAQRSFALYARNLFFTRPLNTRYLYWKSKSSGGIYNSFYRVAVKANADWNRYWRGVRSLFRKRFEARTRQLLSDPKPLPRIAPILPD